MVCFLSAQVNLGKWKDYFSYYHILDVVEKPNELICATENGLFTYDKSTGELVKSSKATGLHGVKISAVAYNENLDYLIVAYQTGAFDVITPEGIEYFVDIPIDTDFQGDKSVNHIATDGDKAIFSMDFGITVFNLSNLEFDNTTYFRINSQYYPVQESVILDNKVIALSSNGIYTHPIDDIISYFNGWEHYFPDVSFQNAELYKGKAIVATSSLAFATEDGINYTSIFNNGSIIDINTGLNDLAIVHSNSISGYNESLNLVNSYTFSEPLTTGVIALNGIFGGTKLKGLINQSTSEEIAPDGPFSNTASKLTIFDNTLYVAPGGRRNFYLPNFINLGYYSYDGTEWINVSAEEVSQYSLMEIAVNPLHPEEVFIGSFGDLGMVKMIDHQFDKLYTFGNSSFAGLLDGNLNQIRICSNIFDKEGYLYVSESFSQNLKGNNLNIKSPDDNWVNIPLALEKESTSFIFQDNKEWLWIGARRTSGKMIAYSTNGTPMNPNDDVFYILGSGEGNGNLPSDENVLCITQDRNSTIWIGTTQGIRFKRNAIAAMEEGDLDTELVVVVQDDIPEEFLKDVLVTDIEVDQANNKWIATGGGVFYVSPDAQTVKKLFTYDNSPLVSDIITDIEINDATGEVFFASQDGIVSYQGDYTTVGDQFGEIIVYPNPVRPNFDGNIVIKGLANNAKVKITDINGNLLFEGIAYGGAIEWDQRNMRGKKVASGIYLALMLNENNLVSATTKFAIVR